MLLIVDRAAATMDKPLGGTGKPADAIASRNGLFDDDDEDLFAPTTTSKQPGAKKG